MTSDERIGPGFEGPDERDASMTDPVSKSPGVSASSRVPADEAPGGRPDRPDRWSFYLNCVVTVMAVVGGWILFDQLRLMRESNRVTRESLDFTIKSAQEGDRVTAQALSAASRSAAAAERAADLAAASVEATKQQLHISQRSLRVTERSVGARDRPWLIVDSVSGRPLNENPQSTMRSRITFTVRNFGTLPALEATVSAMARFGSVPPQFNPLPPDGYKRAYRLRYEVFSRAVVGPGQAISIVDTVNVAAEDEEAVYGGRTPLRLWGVIHYTGVAGDAHTTMFCREFVPIGVLYNEEEHWSACDVHNEAN